MALKVGKLPAAVLARLLAKAPCSDPRVVVGPRIGEDAAVIDFGHTYLVAKTDPITFAAARIGWYGVNVAANDIAAMGARPRWFLATLLLPEAKSDEALASGIFQDIAESCRSLEVSLVGGHTEITAGLDRPILVGQMLGEVEKTKLVCNQHARPGDVIILTKGIPIEATSIIARERCLEVEQRLGRDFLKRAQDFLFSPGISVVREALAANAAADIHAMHDPTEGGLAMGLWELAQASGLGLLVDVGKVVVFEESRRLCAMFGLDPMGAIASGALLIVVAPHDVDKVLSAIRATGVASTPIGVMTPPEEGLRIRTKDGIKPISLFERDEIARLFSE